MIKNDTYFIKVTPYRILEKKPHKTLIVSDRGFCKSVNPVSLTDFKKGDYILRSVMIGGGFIQIEYFKMDDKSRIGNFQDRRLENIFSGPQRN
ncbi:MAG: hypothetical protein ABIE36_01995 [Candidatus Diapherotrites archaeon]